MSKKQGQHLLDTSAIIVGYAMSRLDRRYLKAFKHRSWKAAFAGAGDSLAVAPASLKNLRDEFDPVHGNARRGWHNRPLRTSRQRVLAELCEVSDEGLIALIGRILRRDPDVVKEAVAPLAKPQRLVHNVAERLLTGRLAENYFLEHSGRVIGVDRTCIVDRREDACGYDFGLTDKMDVAIEVKGLKAKRGDILFTDREWREAGVRHENYWLVVIGNLQETPASRVIYDPHASLSAKCRYQQSVRAQWSASVAVTSS